MRNSLCLFAHKFIKLVGISCVTAEMCEKIHELLTELCKKMSDNAVRLYTEKYARGIGLSKYVALVKNVLRTAN